MWLEIVCISLVVISLGLLILEDIKLRMMHRESIDYLKRFIEEYEEDTERLRKKIEEFTRTKEGK